MKPYPLLFSLLFTPMCHASPEVTDQYSTLSTPVSSTPPVVEFFSFYCGPCFQFVEHYPVSDSINNILPSGKEVVKYHVSAMGKMGKELTEAWAIAGTLGIEHQVEKPLFIATQHGKITSIADIENVFEKVGISSEQYTNAQHSLIIQARVTHQNVMVEKFQVHSTPSFYINGKYHINNAGFKSTTPDEYVRKFTNLVDSLLKK